MCTPLKEEMNKKIKNNISTRVKVLAHPGGLIVGLLLLVQAIIV